MTQTTATERRPRLLLVEDDPATRELLALRLENRGCVVSAVDAAEEGIVEAGEIQFDAVVADIHLPGLSGIDLASYLLAQDPGLPVILITGDRDEALAREALSRGPVSYLIKPFEPFEIESVVQQALVRRGWTTEGDGRLFMEPVSASTSDVPKEWKEFVETESFAGPGHGDRVARIAVALLAEIAEEERAITAEEIGLAARTHEVGQLAAEDADPPLIAVQSAELMAEAGFPRSSVRSVRHMHEHWDGSGGPDGLGGATVPIGARILAIADSLDHYASAWLQGGLNCDNAVDRAIHLVTVQQGQAFEPTIISALHRRIEEVRQIVSSYRADAPTESLTTASFAANLADVPFKVA